MSFVRPTLPELVTRIQADFISRLGLAGAVLRRSVIAVLSRVIAGAAHMLHGHLEFLSRQVFPDLAEDEFLERHAALFGITRTSPTYASATLTFTGTTGVTITSGRVLVSADGFRFATTAGFTLVAGTVSGTVNALVPGAASSLAVGQVLNFESPQSGVDATAVVTSVIDGSDAETFEALRVRLLEHLAEPAHGGSVADYVAWAKEVGGVTRVWVTPLELGPGTVVVRFTRDLDASPIPDAGEVTNVQTKLDLEKPAHVVVTAFAPVAAPLAFTLSITPDTGDLRTAVSNSLAALFLDTAPGETTLLSKVRTAIGATDGITDYTLTTPSANVTHTTNELPTLGAITWV